MDLAEQLKARFGVAEVADLVAVLPEVAQLPLAVGLDRFTASERHFQQALAQMQALVKALCCADVMALFPVLGHEREVWLAPLEQAGLDVGRLSGGYQIGRDHKAWMSLPLAAGDLEKVLRVEAADGVRVQPGGPNGLVLLDLDKGLMLRFWGADQVAIHADADQAAAVQAQVTQFAATS